MIDIHSHVPTHRDTIPADELGLDEEQREAILVTNPRRLLAA